ncbi:hypothetical protein RhiirA5_394016 [Rhizophagus irregularis]|uniref:Protein kinase domain-containing protein n=1 Tax=Rhizophagus irregularis TaxID=588596 RepID=A0A2N0QD27_9GLOM|nr:hypothetical protein RhiirA5_394016 [Rhizophagus irregularis]
MKYVAQNTSIRVPEVYDWDSEAQNDIKIPYILMEYLPGTQLHKAYDEIGPIMSQLFYIEGKNDIPNVLNYTGPFGSKRELCKKLVEKFNYIRQGQMQKCDWKIIHGDFDEQNILVGNNFSIIDWKFSCTGTLWDICKYPSWI